MHLTIHEVSKLLNLPVSTLKRWIRQGNIPVYRHAGKYVFLKKDLRKWARSHGIVLASESKQTVDRNEPESYSLLRAMKKGGMLDGVRGDDPSSVLKAVVESAPLDPSVDRHELFARLIEREELASTGIGHGVAIPHPRSPLSNGAQEPSITTSFLEVPIDYDAIDALPVFVLFLILSPSPQIHLRLLAKLSHLLRDSSFVDFLKGVPSRRELLSWVKKIESGTDTAPHTSNVNNAS
jgi:PTS system nitrogen regulatory IIA component